MAKAFQIRPSEFFGFDAEEEGWLAYMVDRATWLWGSTVEAWERETVEKPAPKTKKRFTIQVPKRSPEWIKRAIYGPLPKKAEGSLATVQGAPASGLPDLDSVLQSESDDYIPPRWRGQNVQDLVDNLPRGEK